MGVNREQDNTSVNKHFELQFKTLQNVLRDPDKLHAPLSIPYFLKECTKKDRYWSGFGGIRDRFDLIIPPGKMTNMSMGSIGLVPISVLKVGC
jgi:hypothetical protein